MTPETISIGVTLGSKYTFHLRMIGISEEQELRQKTFGLTDEAIKASEYERNVNLLADLSVKNPDGIESQPIELEPKHTILDFFKEKTVSKERIAYYAVRAYFVRLQPDVDFF